MSWRSATWLRCLGWTLIVGLVFVACGLVFDKLPLTSNHDFILAALASMVAVLLIGARVHEWWWVWGPVIVLVVPCLVIAVWTLMANLWDPLATGILLVSSGAIAVIGSILHTLPAAAGVWWGKHREENDFPSRAYHSDDGSRFRSG